MKFKEGDKVKMNGERFKEFSHALGEILKIKNEGVITECIGEDEYRIKFKDYGLLDLDEKDLVLIEEADKFFIDSTKKRIIIESMAHNIKLLKNFKDVRILDDADNPSLAFVEMKTKILYINLGDDFLDFTELIKHLEAIIVHENGHIDKRLVIPGTFQRAKEDFKRLGKIASHELLNILYDWEIHYQYIHGNVKPTQRRKLQEFLTTIRNRAFEQGHGEDIILSMEYPQTDVQKQIKKIVSSRRLSLMKKYKLIWKLLDKNNMIKKTRVCVLGENFSDDDMEGEKQEGDQSGQDGDEKEGQGKDKKEKDSKKDKKGKMGKGKGQKKGQKRSKRLKAKSISIKRDIKQQRKISKIKETMKSMGFSDEDIAESLKRYSVIDLIENIKNLDSSLRDVLPNLQKSESKEKTRQYTTSKGHRLNGYHKLKDFSEVSENVEDLMTIGQYDINELRIPTKIRRHTKGTIFIVRDCSGSVSSHPLCKYVRDSTVTLIKIAKSKGHNIAVMDFSSNVEEIKDKKGKVVTADYNFIMLESMAFREGSSTIMSKAIKRVNELIKENKIENENINVVIVSDSYVDHCKEKLLGKRVNLVSLWVKEGYYSDHPNSNFTEFTKLNNGKMFKIEKIKNELTASLFDAVVSEED